MKVLHIINSIDKSTGGPSRSVPQTCLELSKLGVDIEIVTQESTDMVAITENSHLKVKYMTFWELYRYGSGLSVNDVDLIHLQHIWNPYIQVMAYWANRKKIPYIITPRGMLEPWILAQNPWKKKLGLFLYQNKAIQRAKCIHATAQMEANNIRALGFNNPIYIIPNGIDLSNIKESKKKYGTKKIVFLSRIHPKKGIEILLEAWRNCNSEGWTLEIAGNGDENYIEKLIRSAQDIKNVNFVGAKYGVDKWNFLLSADAMVLPTYSENFGIVVAEALAVGVPVITTTGTPWQDLESYNCGWWIDLSVENLKSTLSKIFNTPADILEEMGTNGIKLVKEKYDIQAIGKNMVELYSNILKR